MAFLGGMAHPITIQVDGEFFFLPGWERELPILATIFSSPSSRGPTMTLSKDYTSDAPSREQVDAMQGALVLEFGTGWCGFCQAAQPAITSALIRHPGIPHLKVEDGPGRALGRSFHIKLWPTLVFLRDGQEVARVVRPNAPQAISEALVRIEPVQEPAIPAT
jgi:thioredoxin 1